MPPEEFVNEEIDIVQLTRSPSRSRRLAQNPLIIPASILLGALIIGISIIIGLAASGAKAVNASDPGAPAATAADVSKVHTDGVPFIGKPDAPVTLAYWSDYQCPYCKAFEVGGVPQINNTIPAAMPEIIAKYVDTGKVKVVFKEFPFLGQDSITAAEYAYAIWDLYPAQFYNWRVAMFHAQDEEGDKGFGNATSIDALIKTKFPQLDLAKIKARVALKKSDDDAAMNADKTEGGTYGIQGTPGFITGKQMIGGDAPFSTFQAAIDGQLK